MSIFTTSYYFDIPFPTETNQGFLKNWVIPGFGQEMYTLTLVIFDHTEALGDH